MKWFVLAKAINFSCPFCMQRPAIPYVPVLQLYKQLPDKPGNFINEKQRLVVWHGLYLYKWHVY
jgi:hypothetical protein